MAAAPATPAPDPTPTTTPTLSPNPTSTPTPMSPPSSTPSATPTPAATPTAPPSPTPSASPAPASTGSPTPTADPSTTNLCSPGGAGLGAPGAPGLGFYNGPVCIGTTQLPDGRFEMTDPARPGLSCGASDLDNVLRVIQNKGPLGSLLGPRFTASENTWGNGTPSDFETACVDAMYAGGAEWDMLRAWLGRNGMDGQGGAAGIGVELPTGPRPPNPFLNEAFFLSRVFGGPAVILGPLGMPPTDPEESPGALEVPDTQGRQVSSMDVVAHEFGHEVFSTTPGGTNFDLLEQRALDEGTADIMAQLTIAFASNPRVPLTYTLGSQLFPQEPFRIMYEPALRGDPNCYSPGLFTNLSGEPLTPEQGIGPHSAAGPLNHWFYLLAEGSNPAGLPASHTCDLSTLTGLGIKTAGQIWYNALLQKTSTWTYRDARSASLTAALRLFPGTCTEFDKVKAAWNAVSVPALPNEPTCGVPPPTPAPTPAPTLPPVVPPTAVPLTPGLPTTGMIAGHSQSVMARAVPVALGGLLLLPLLSLCQWRWRRSRRKG
ncbi:MAG: M4 family metallopeptidase [Candidatus Dormibacteraeota bacterium]|nr:M4 family metallopeptidase [Candidatus Dormibacteraeota bacterium]